MAQIWREKNRKCGTTTRHRAPYGAIDMARAISKGKGKGQREIKKSAEKCSCGWVVSDVDFQVVRVWFEPPIDFLLKFYVSNTKKIKLI